MAGIGGLGVGGRLESLPRSVYLLLIFRTRCRCALSTLYPAVAYAYIVALPQSIFYPDSLASLLSLIYSLCRYDKVCRLFLFTFNRSHVLPPLLPFKA